MAFFPSKSSKPQPSEKGFFKSLRIHQKGPAFDLEAVNR